MDAKLELAIEMAVARSLVTIKSLLPRDTGKLQDVALRVKMLPDGLEVYIDDIVAPYAKYPNVQKKIDQVWPTITRRVAEDIAFAINGKLE